MPRKTKRKNKKNKYVIIAGFPRCGSTYLAYLLKQHPDISASRIKEVCYWNHTHKFFMRPNFRHHRSRNSFEWYENLFDHDKKRLIDFSILTSYDMNSPQRIKEKLGDIKIIFLVRNREEHMRSLFEVMVQLGEIPKMSFEEYLEKYPFYASYYSAFEEHIERFRKVFSNVLVCNIVNGDTRKEVDKMIKFLSLPKYDFNYKVYRNSREERRQADFLQPWKRRLFIYYPNIHGVIKRMKDKIIPPKGAGRRRY